MGRARVLARREGVLETNGVFSVLDQVVRGLRERSGNCRTRTRSLPSNDFTSYEFSVRGVDGDLGASRRSGLTCRGGPGEH
jgi:hypothetical protein